MMMSKEKVNELASTVSEDIIAWRRHLHQNPELSFQEEQTSQFVFDTLSTFTNLIVTRPTKTSVMARLIGDMPGKTLGLRADMDALPIQEENSFAFVSNQPGVMHACGHDGHTATLLGVAKIFSQLKSEIHGEIRFFFQHAEELFPGGAQEMVKAGVMEGVDTVIGAHLWAGMPVGKIGVASGPLMAAPDTFHITITGKGGHAAAPHETVDPIVIGAQIVTNLQHIVSRNTDPLASLVVSVTQFIAGTADNIIPGSAMLAGTVRTFDPALRATVKGKIERILQGICDAHEASFQFEYQRGYNPVINDREVSDFLSDTLNAVFDEGVVIEAVPTMGGEDFSAFLQKTPGSFFFIGAGNLQKGIVYPHHHPRFTVDEDALSIGVKAFVSVALNFLSTAVIH